MDKLECPGCQVVYPGPDQCPACGRYLVIKDPRPPYIPRLTVAGKDPSALWSITVQVAQGLEPAGALSPLLKTLESTFRADLSDPSMDGELQHWLGHMLAALAQIHQFVDTRQASDLNQGWVNFIPALDGFRTRWEALGVDMDGRHDHSAWWQRASDFLQPTDRVELSDPDE